MKNGLKKVDHFLINKIQNRHPDSRLAILDFLFFD